MYHFLLLLFFVIIGEGQAKLCGSQNECICLKNLRLASCLRKKLVIVPKFSQKEQSLFDYLDLRWNNIHSLPSDDNFLRELHHIDMTHNPVQCDNFTRWQNVKTDCLDIDKDSYNKNNSISFKTTFIGSFSGNRHFNKRSTISQFKSQRRITISASLSTSSDRTTQIGNLPKSEETVPTTVPDPETTPALDLHNIEVISTTTLPDPPTRFESTLPAREITLASTVPNPEREPTPNSHKSQRIPTLSVSTMAVMRVDQTEEAQSIDFYLHVTLGPMGVLYVLGSLIIILKRWWRRRRQHTREM